MPKLPLPSAEFRRRSGGINLILFSGDMCGGKKTARGENVREKRVR